MLLNIRTGLSLIAILVCCPVLSGNIARAQVGDIEGFIVDEYSGEALPGVNIYLENTTIGGMTGPDGLFVIENVPIGNYTLIARLIGYASRHHKVVIQADHVQRVRLSLHEQPIEIPEIVIERVMLTGGRHGLLDVPGSAHYVGPKQLDNFSYNDIQRVLRGVPGVNIQEEDGYGLRPNIGMRGTGTERSSKITVMEDGVLMAPAPYAAPSAYYFPTVGRMQAVEVRKGSSQIKYGPYTTGGAINLVSTQIPNEFSGHAEILAGGDENRTVHAHVGDSYKHVGFLVETYQAKSDGFKNLESGGPTGFDKKDFLAKIRFNTSRTASVYQAITAKISQTDETSNETYLGLTDADFQQTPNLRYAGSQIDLMQATQRHAIVRHVVRPSRFVDITTTAYRTEFERDWYKLDRVRATVDDAGVSISAILDDPQMYNAEFAILRGATSTNDNALEVKHNNRAYYAQGLQSIVGLSFSGGSLSHDTEFGVRIHDDEMDRFQWVDLYSMNSSVMSLTQAGEKGTESNRIERASAISSYVQYSVSGVKWSVTPGIRYEHITISRDDYGGDDPDRSGENMTTRENVVNAFIPGVGFDYNLTSKLKLFTGVHKGFAPPGSREDTKPEESTNYELGGRYFSGVVAAEGVVFFNDYSNLLGADLASSGGQGTADQFNGGEVNTAGVELSTGYDFGAIHDMNLSIPINIAYTYTRARFVNSFESEFEPWGSVREGDALPYLPAHQLALGVGIRTLKAGIEVSGKYVSEMRTVAGQGSIAPSESIGHHFVVDIAGNYSISRYVKLFATVRNVSDESYVVARRPAGLRPGLPRLFLLGLKTDF